MRNRATTPLKKAKFRQSWNKYNLYNLSRLTAPPNRGKTFFQLKWKSKSVLRQYHGEQVREGQWIRMFTRKFKSVIPMDAKYLASNDGSVESAGRGSGLKLRQEGEKFSKSTEAIPHMAMTFAPLERRLDTAVFRSLFASSARQARQFVVHGAVKVNGKKMIYPGYLLNPGDMFQVDPERVMYATGQPKSAGDKVEAEEDTTGEKEASEEAEKGEESKEAETEEEKDPRKVLKTLLSQAKELLSNASEKVPGKRKQDVRAFQKAIKRTLSSSKKSTILTDSLEAQFLEIKRLLKIPDQIAAKEAADKATKSEGESDQTAEEKKDEKESSPTPTPKSSESEVDIATLTDSDIRALHRAMALLRDNPVDPSKPYATPWSPRNYMSAFAFIPRFLEVNHNICAAVYLRHPVARPGLAEVPSPFGSNVQSDGFNWYLRRR